MVLPADRAYLMAAALGGVEDVKECLQKLKPDPYAVDEEGDVLKEVKKKRCGSEEGDYLEIEEESQAKRASALHLACIYGTSEVVQFLATTFPTLIETLDSFRNTPILFAIQREAAKFFWWLFLAQAKLNCANRAGWNAFHLLAGEREKYPCLEAAFNALNKIKGAVSAVLNQKTHYSGHTPLCKAIEEGNTQAVALLRSHTDPKLKDNTGLTVQEKLDLFDRVYNPRSDPKPDSCCAIL